MKVDGLFLKRRETQVKTRQWVKRREKGLRMRNTRSLRNWCRKGYGIGKKGKREGGFSLPLSPPFLRLPRSLNTRRNLSFKFLCERSSKINVCFYRCSCL